MNAEPKIRIEATVSTARSWLNALGTVTDASNSHANERLAQLASAVRKAVAARPLLAWTNVTVDGRPTGSWDATIGTREDGATFTLSYRETCYRRGRWLLLIQVHEGPRHHAWGCFDAADQPERDYHDLQNAVAEAEAIAAVLLADRAEHGPIAGWVPPGVKNGSD